MTFTEVQRKARYGHRNWLIWRDDAGNIHHFPVSVDAAKRALLDCGCHRTWTMFCSDGTPMLMRWNIGIIVWKNATVGSF